MKISVIRYGWLVEAGKFDEILEALGSSLAEPATAEILEALGPSLAEPPAINGQDDFGVIVKTSKGWAPAFVGDVVFLRTDRDDCVEVIQGRYLQGHASPDILPLQESDEDARQFFERLFSETRRLAEILGRPVPAWVDGEP